jgi:SAM-dependent methyltransferase
MGVKERLSLEEASAPTLIAVEHRHRYRFATGLLAGRRVLDLCCGSGYGTLTLSETAQSVHGVDNDPAAVDAAATRAKGATFEVADALEFVRRPDTRERFDAIVCFEGLEHVHALDALLERLHELAQSGVVMILSVPNSKGLEEVNEYHVTDFAFEDAVEKLGSFPGAVMLTQSLAEGSVLVAAETPGVELEAQIVLAERDEPEYANHFVFCIGLDPGPADGIMHLEAAPAANRYMRNLERANAELRRVNQRLMRDRLGRADSGAGAFVAKYEEAVERRDELARRYAELESEHRAWVDRCHGAEAREVAALERLAEAEERLDSVLVHALIKASRAVRRD